MGSYFALATSLTFERRTDAGKQAMYDNVCMDNPPDSQALRAWQFGGAALVPTLVYLYDMSRRRCWS